MRRELSLLIDVAVFATWVIVISTVFKRLGAMDTNEFYIILIGVMLFQLAGRITSWIRSWE